MNRIDFSNRKLEIVILSEGSRSLIARTAVEGPAVSLHHHDLSRLFTPSLLASSSK
jgi:hypothetical protein